MVGGMEEVMIVYRHLFLSLALFLCLSTPSPFPSSTSIKPATSHSSHQHQHQIPFLYLFPLVLSPFLYPNPTYFLPPYIRHLSPHPPLGHLRWFFFRLILCHLPIRSLLSSFVLLS